MYINLEHKRADELMDKHKFEEAVLAFNKALELNSNHPVILSQRGVAFLHLNQKKNCLDDLELSLKLEDDNAYRYASLAYACDHFGDLDRAIELYEQAVELDPEDAIAYNNLGLLLEKKGYEKRAQKTFNQADGIIMNQEEMKKRLDDYNTEKDKEEEAKKANPLPKPDRNNPLPNKPVGEPVQPKKLEAEKTPSIKQVSKDLFTKKSSFKEFLEFIKDGFKLKK